MGHLCMRFGCQRDRDSECVGLVSTQSTWGICACGLDVRETETQSAWVWYRLRVHGAFVHAVWMSERQRLRVRGFGIDSEYMGHLCMRFGCQRDRDSECVGLGSTR